MLIYIYFFLSEKEPFYISSLVREFLNSFLGFFFLADWFLFFIEIMSRCEMSMVLKWSTRTNCISGNKRIQDKANDDTLLKCFTVLKISPLSKSVRLNLVRTKFHCFGFFFFLVGKDINPNKGFNSCNTNIASVCYIHICATTNMWALIIIYATLNSPWILPVDEKQ